ncbi:MAG: Mrp/NBP35 family ATP-binding protein [Clostridiales bacterium]|nr:Mrp/NBP35 family ATP-binding protein [Clostridiales bacterium]
MANCDNCPSKGSCGKKSEDCGVKQIPENKIKKVIGIMSGKGGVGKSTISVMLANELAEKGYKVGLLDADITGPSTVRLMGLTKEKAYSDGKHFLPVISQNGIKVISLNLMLDDENSPVIWRGSLLSSCVIQFWNEVLWGELDYLIIDMPPGTGDITLTVMQQIPISGVVMVSLPQDMVSMIVTKAINMANMMKIKVIGIIENMSYIICPHCGEKINIYGSSADLAKNAGSVLLGELPTTPALASFTDKGLQADEKVKAEFRQITDKILKMV